MASRAWRLLALSALCLALARPVAAETIKVGYVDPLSGTFAQSGDQFLKVFQYIIDKINAKGGALGRKFELVPFDDKTQPAEALIALKSITDQNIPFVMQCSGSNVGAALIDGVAKHNARNPDNRIIYLNCGALADELTNEQCDFWHFRFAGNVAMRARTLIAALPKNDVYGLFPNLGARADTAAGVLSGGEQQMLSMCRTLMGDPDLVLIDEPTEGLAPKLVEQVGVLLGEIAKRGVAILLVEQKLTIALRISHRLYVMGHGRIVFEGTPDGLAANEGVRKEWLEV